MRNFLVAGLIQNETIVKVDSIPLDYVAVSNVPHSIFSGIGGAAYNEALALSALGNKVDFLTMIGENDKKSMVNPPESEVILNTDFILPVLDTLPSSVVLYDKERNQQRFKDRKNASSAVYPLEIFEERARLADMVVLTNAAVCKNFLNTAKKMNKKIAVNFREYREETMDFNGAFMEEADIIYISDSHIVDASDSFIQSLSKKYDPEIIIMGQGAKGLIIYSKQNDILAHYNTVKTNKVVNTVGAGNALFSCFLHYYAHKADPIYAVKCALLFASYKIGFMGSSNGFMSQEQLQQWYELIWREKIVT